MKRIIFILPLVLIGFSVFAQEEINTNKESKELPEIYFKETTHDFGTMEYGGDGVVEFQFKNTGKQPLLLTNVRASCGCTTPTWPKQPIKKGKKGVISVKYNTKIVGKFSKTIKIYSNAKNSMITLTVKGVVNRPNTNN